MTIAGLVRVKRGIMPPPSTTTLTVTFDETTPLDSTHLLVVLFSGNSVPNTLTGWTLAASASSVSSGSRSYIWARQADGSINSVTISSPTYIEVVLLAFSGYVSATKLGSGTGTPASGITSLAMSLTTTPAGDGVNLAVQTFGTGGTGAPRSFTNGFEDLTRPTGTLFRQIATGRNYTGSGTEATTSSWTGATASDSSYVMAAFDLIPPPAAYWSLALGAKPVTPVLGTGVRTPQLGAEPDPPPVTSYAEEVMADAPGLWWRLGEAAPTNFTVAADASGNGRTGSFNLYSGTVSSVAGLVAGDADTAVDFLASCVERPWESWMDDMTFTVEAIVNPDDNIGYHAIVTCDGNSLNRGWNLYTSNGLLHCLNAATGLVSSTNALSMTSGNHVAMVANASDVRLYINGTLDGVSGAPMSAPYGPARVFMAGASVAGSTGRFFGFDGIIDEVAWYPTPLSAARILVHAQKAGLA